MSEYTCANCGKKFDSWADSIIDHVPYSDCMIHLKEINAQLLEALDHLVKNLPELEVDRMRESIGRTNSDIIWRAVIQGKAAIADAEASHD